MTLRQDYTTKRFEKSLAKQPGTVAKFGTNRGSFYGFKYSNLTLMSAKEHQARNKELHWNKDEKCPY